MDVNALNGMSELIETARKSARTEVETIKRLRDGDVPFAVVDKGKEVKDVTSLISGFEKTQSAPYRRRGVYKAANIASLLAWMAEHCLEAAPVFGTGAETLAAYWAKPSLALVGIGNYSRADNAEWHDFTARYDFPPTAAWLAWCEKSGEWLSQGEFAEFIETHLYEFAEPKRSEELPEAVTRMIEALGGGKVCASPSAMYDLAKGVSLMVEQKVEVAMDRTTGEANLRFSEEHTGAGGRPVKIPKFFYMRIPVFFGEPEQLIGALLRYRNAGGGKVVWSYQLFAPDLVVKAAFDKACEAVKKAKRTLYLGSPDMPG